QPRANPHVTVLQHDMRVGSTMLPWTRQMGGRRAICVCHDETRRIVEPALRAAGLVVEHLLVVPPSANGAALVVVDRAARQAAGDALTTVGAPVVVVGDDLDDDGLITMMLEAPVSHLVGDPRDKDFGITSAKLASGDVFGLEKYVTGPVSERLVQDDLGKHRALDEVAAWAESIGARLPTMHRLHTVLDELLMNALREGGPAALRWAADDQTIAVSVEDGRGSLRQRDIIDHVRRARRDSGRPEPASTEGGAGLGLYLVLANVASLVINIAPGRRTEIVCMFDLARRARPSVARVRSLHVFGAA
ncbi:MAG TPA: ATP-binding protein, partial [Kofleriaceae bacterium]|nr:ATP-binding protein [Kofleriaceae bacterium]